MAEYSLRTQTAYLFVGRIIGFVVGSLSPVILVRMMDGDTFGTYRQLMWVALVASELGRLAIPTSLYYFFPRKQNDRSRLMTQTMTLQILASLTVTAVFVGICGGLGWLPSGVGREYVWPMAGYLLLEGVSFIMEHLFIVEKKPRLVLLASISGPAMMFVVVVGSLLAFHTVMGIVYGLIAYSVLRGAFLTAYLIRHYRIGIGIVDRELLREQMHYMLPLAGSMIVGMIGAQIDKGIISGLMSPEQFAVYSLGGVSVLGAVTLFTNSLGNVCLTRLGELAAVNDRQAMRDLWHKLVVVNGIALIPSICFAFFFAYEIVVALYTKRYVACMGLFRINLLTLVMAISAYGTVPTALGRTKSIMAGNTIRSIVSSVLCVLLIPRIGLAGGAIALVAAYWANGLVQLGVVKRELAVTAAGLLPWRSLAGVFAISVTPAILLSFASRLGRPPLQTLAMAGPAYFVLVILAFHLAGYLNIRNWRTVFQRA